MHSTETVNQFLNLRLQGWTFARIADHLHVSKPTLIQWSHKHHSTLESLKAAQQRSLQDSLQSSRELELENLNLFHNALRQELVSRSLQSISTDQIEVLAGEFQLRIEKLSGCPDRVGPNGK